MKTINSEYQLTTMQKYAINNMVELHGKNETINFFLDAKLEPKYTNHDYIDACLKYAYKIDKR